MRSSGVTNQIPISRTGPTILTDRGARAGTVRLVSRVVVVGSANVDVIWHGPRLPGPGETTTDGEFDTALGGKGANQAAAARALGAPVRFVGCVGDDERGWAVLGDLDARGVDCTFVARSTDPTGVAIVLVDEHGENMVAVAPGANRALAPEAVDDAIEADDVVLCSCEIPLDVVAARGGDRQRPRRDRHRQSRAAACGLRGRDPHAQRARVRGAGRCRCAPGSRARGRRHPRTRGRRAASPGTAPITQPSFAVEAVDTTGAGDAFNGALAWALLEGRALPAAVRFACAAGALATRGLGARASLPTPEEVYVLATS